MAPIKYSDYMDPKKWAELPKEKEVPVKADVKPVVVVPVVGKSASKKGIAPKPAAKLVQAEEAKLSAELKPEPKPDFKPVPKK